jgi:hypothetical protein
MGFVVEEVALGDICLGALLFFPERVIPAMMHT